MRLSHTMKTGHFLRLIRDTPLRHWDGTGGNAVRCETSSSLFLEIDSDVTLLSDIVNPNGYYTIPNDTPIVEVCLRLPIKDDTMPTYEFLLELGRIIAQSREGYFDTDHRCAKSLPMLMLVLENERQAEQLQSAVCVVMSFSSISLLTSFARPVYKALAASPRARQLPFTRPRSERI